MTKYMLFIRYALTGVVSKVIECQSKDDLYKFVGKLVLRSIEHIDRIDYFALEKGEEQ